MSNQYILLNSKKVYILCEEYHDRSYNVLIKNFEGSSETPLQAGIQLSDFDVEEEIWDEFEYNLKEGENE